MATQTKRKSRVKAAPAVKQFDPKQELRDIVDLQDQIAELQAKLKPKTKALEAHVKKSGAPVTTYSDKTGVRVHYTGELVDTKRAANKIDIDVLAGIKEVGMIGVLKVASVAQAACTKEFGKNITAIALQEGVTKSTKFVCSKA